MLIHGAPASPDTAGQNVNLPLTDIVPEYYSRSRLVRWLFRKRLRAAADYVKALKPLIMVDLGCGDGQFLRLLNEQGIPLQEMWGVDINPHVIELNGKIPGGIFAQRSLFDTAFRRGMFDAVVCLDVLEHVRDIEKAIAEIRRILRPGGCLITSEPVESVLYRSLRFILKGTYSQETGPGAGTHYFNAWQIDRMIRATGFVRQRSTKIPFYPPLDLFHVNAYLKG